MQGEELKALRVQTGMSRKKLEEELGLTVGYVGRMERGDKPIEKRTAIAARCILEHQHHD
jgi:transcriptional regulator with XRE-family HTH domain